ncbi:unnamed protein product [Closterium sp. NIES-54]
MIFPASRAANFHVKSPRSLRPSSTTNMKASLVRRTTPLDLVVLCAAFLTAVASAPIVPPFLLTRSALHGGVSTTAPAAQAKPLVWKGRTVCKCPILEAAQLLSFLLKNLPLSF